MRPAAASFSTFLRTACAVLLAASALVAMVVAIVDPYGLYGLVDQEGFNHIKPGLTRYQVQIKQARAQSRARDFIIMGNSRAEIGLDPRAPVFGGAAGYNLAIPGTSVYTSIDQLKALAQAHATPPALILGVEFIDFLRPAVSTRARAHAPAPARGTPFWRADALFSLTSLTDAVRTVSIQNDAEASIITPDGFNPLNEYLAFVRDDGYEKIFTQRAQESAATLRSKSTSAFGDDDFNALHRFLMTATEQPADIRLMIYPYHAQMLGLFEATGLWPLFEQWKRGLVNELARMRALRPGARITLVDFSGFGPYNCEPIPTAAQRGAATTWYWEAGHFKKALGDIVLQRLMTSAPAGALDPAFGVKLDATTLAANSARIATERATCAAANPALFSDIGKLAARPR